MFIFINVGICFIYMVSAQACLRDKVSSVTIQNYDGPIYVSPCNQNSESCGTQLFHISGNPNCDSDCTCISKMEPEMPPVLFTQTPCIISTPQVPCVQTPCTISTPQVPCVQTPCVISTPQVSCVQTPCAISTPQVPCAQSSCLPIGTLPCTCNAFTSGGSQGCVSLQGSYLQTWQGSGTPWTYYQSCPDQYSDGWPQCYKGNDLGSLPVAKCANQFCQCGQKRSGYY